MHSIWNFFLRKRAFTYLLMGVLVLTGLYSLIAIPKESAPEIIIPMGIVSTGLRGASAEDTEKLITNKLEDEIVNVEDIDKVTSSSREGVSVITAQFNASADIDKSLQNLKDAVDRVKGELPTDATDPMVMKINFADQPMLIVSVSQDLSPAGLTKLGEDLKSDLKKVEGVSKVEISGTRKREIQVVVRKDELANYGLSLAQVVSAIQGANASFPIGSITVADVDYPIKFAGSIEDANEIPDITIATPSGVPVYLRDIAFIADGLQAPSTYSRISTNGQPSENALTLNIYKKSGGDVTKIAAAVNKRIEELQKDGQMLSGAQVVTTIDTGKLVKKDLTELTRTGLETVVLVMLVLFLTIGWRESLVAGLSIPLSFVIAFTGLYLSGNTINFMSLFSLILAIGILVDSGIVVAEAIHARIKIYGSAEAAAIASIKEYAWPLIAGTMTTVAVFAPLFFLSGIVGKFISSIPFTIIFVLLASIVVALGFVPLLAIILTKDHKSRFEDLQEEWSLKAQSWYKGFLGKILDSAQYQKRFFIALAVGFVLALAMPITGLLKVSFFPQDDQDYVFISVERPQGTPLSQTDLSVREVEEILYTSPYVESFVTTVGASSALTGSGSNSGSKLANITVLLPKDRKLTSTEIVEKLRDELHPVTSADVKVDQGNNGPQTGAPVVIKFKGDDLEELGEAANKAETILASIPGTQDVTTSLKDDGTQFEIVVDRAKASQAGLSAASVAQILRTAVSGVTATTIKKSGTDIDIIVKTDLNPDFVNPEDTIRTTVDSIKNIPIVTPSGSIFLGSVIDVKLSESRATISHEDLKRVVTVESNLTATGNALEVVKEFKKHEAELALPSTVEVKYGGDNEEIQKTFTEMGLALIAGMALMLMILVLEFNSFRYSFYLLMAIPLSLIGVLGGLTLTRQALSFSSMLGLIALAGVIINHAIILLDSILHRLEHEREEMEAGHSSRRLRDVIIDASAIRLRPIFLTTITTVIGMVPLAGVSALWGPLAFAIMFGLMFAMILTLVLIPVFFYRYPGKYTHLK